MKKRPLPFTAAHKVRTLIEEDSLLLMVLNRFGISFGFGDKTVRQVCADEGIDCQSFLAVCNFISHRDHTAFSISLPALMDYLRKAHSYFLDFFLPSIRLKIIQSINASTVIDDVALLLIKFYDEYAEEIHRHMEYENSHIFSYVEHLLRGESNGGFRISDYSRHHDSMADKLDSLKDIFIRHYHHKDNAILTSALCDIITFNQDLVSHCEIEEQLFIPAVMQLEKTLSIQEGDGRQTPEADQTKESPVDLMTEREKEIICCVARGMPNKQIADTLCLSIHTVTTYRRNISAKLQIHSAAGLTIFAILHNLIDLNDVNPYIESGCLHT